MTNTNVTVRLEEVDGVATPYCLRHRTPMVAYGGRALAEGSPAMVWWTCPGEDCDSMQGPVVLPEKIAYEAGL